MYINTTKYQNPGVSQWGVMGVESEMSAYKLLPSIGVWGALSP